MGTCSATDPVTTGGGVAIGDECNGAPGGDHVGTGGGGGNNSGDNHGALAFCPVTTGDTGTRATGTNTPGGGASAKLAFPATAGAGPNHAAAPVTTGVGSVWRSMLGSEELT